MRRILSAALATLLSFGAFATERILTGEEAAQEIEGASLIRFIGERAIPDYIAFETTERIAFSTWQDWMNDQFLSDRPGVGFQLINEQHDQLGMIHYRFRQVMNGYPISFATWIVHTINGEVVSMNGSLIDTELNLQPGLSEEVALQHALTAFGAETYMWELEEEAWLQMEQGDPEATYFPEGQLTYVNPSLGFENGEWHLAYKFNIYAHSPLARRELFIDASTGTLLFENDLIHHVDSNGVAHTGYSGVRDIVADYTGSNFRLREQSRGNGVSTYNLNNSTSGANGDDFFDNDNVWNFSNISTYALDAHFGAEMTYDYFWENFGRNSIDDNGFELISRVHYGTNYVNAFWDGTRMTYGDGNAAYTPLTTLDIAGHEIAHGLTNFTSNLVYQDEPGALNESFSDIFGAAIEFYALGVNNGDWFMGEDIGNPFRNLANPNQYDDPDTYDGLYWYEGPNDNGGVHINSGVQNFWFHLLTVGGTGTNDIGDNYNVTGIGVDDAGAIAYRNDAFYLTELSQYIDARFYGIQSALDLFGPCSQQVVSTGNAWHAVGLGSPYVPYVDANFSSNSTGNCYVPVEIEFYDMSSNATSLFWDLGDGTTSTQSNPVHTYTTPGAYDVTLVVSSSCGADTTVLPEYIKVGPDAPCEVILPGSGVASQQDACEGVIYDNGGPAGSYSNEANSYAVIYPSYAGSIDLEITDFDVQSGNGSSCDADYLEVFDGIGLTAPSLGKFCNNNLPPSVITSSSNAVTVRFFSNEEQQKPGFKVTWSCNEPTEAPAAEFDANAIETCDGEVQFFDQSLNGANQWAWDFGDGNSSSLQNPVHTYSSGGTYTVELTVSNGIGSNTVTKTNYIEVTRPNSPEVAVAEICPGESATLEAIGEGTHLWYSSPTATTPLLEGDIFITPVIQTTEFYYVESLVEGNPESGGALGNGIGTGGYHNFPASLYFDAHTSFVLESVKVYSSTSAVRTIELVDENGNVVESRSVNINFGQHIVPLDMTVPAGEDYQLRLSGASVADLYRNTSGASYPYEVPGVLSITRSSSTTAPLDYYYFFYDWQIREFCVSERSEAIASVWECLGVDELTDASLDVFPNPTNGRLQVVFNTQADRSMFIYNSQGALVMQKQTNALQDELDLSEMAKGIYLLNVVESNQLIQKRIVLE